MAEQFVSVDISRVDGSAGKIVVSDLVISDRLFDEAAQKTEEIVDLAGMDHVALCGDKSYATNAHRTPGVGK